MIDARLPWLRQLREMQAAGFPIYDIHGALDTSQLTRLIREHVPLDRFFEAGRAHSWEQN